VIVLKDSVVEQHMQLQVSLMLFILLVASNMTCLQKSKIIQNIIEYTSLSLQKTKTFEQHMM